MTLYENLFRHVAVRVPAERTHRIGLRALAAATPVIPERTPDPSLAVTAMGLEFPSPLGVAAGYDKDAEGVRGLARLGFGAVEIGTVTARPQPGNPRPRLFRLPDDRALVNRMGFNNAGADVVAERLAALRAAGPLGTVLGVNIGKSKAASGPERTVADYRYSARTLGPHADYVVVNVSSPNTPGLRDLQGVDALEPLLTAVRDEIGATPLLVKITADLDGAGVDAVADLAVAAGLDGIVATNTTVARTGLVTDPAVVDAAGAGGLSGAPLVEPARAILDRLVARVGGRLTIVSVGGIADAAEARRRLEAGATLVQSYTGFVYGGPAWPSRVNAELARSPHP
ncbi:quinone-dependent dihydroorotate dehydrogenase [Actinomycetospora sp. NBRC 106378]|uniref:quinone-dependent dihydroorotate dehydrogenase n=1 Tax=Actinomycetospora sp. NBRC 106378 TaxID=3032208 RepID=UPI0024A443E6|nr:quinone-dependent dihydroorotate dehydrogenase [Actinomycetospora sp. NBRC 106378]GLZ52285.1 dihydroorotate dehydrogenase (quinone) [Actinomycetospora sp. NBRC 106378]